MKIPPGKQCLFLRPYDDVVATWRRAISHAYDPENLFKRFSIKSTRLTPSGSSRRPRGS